MGRPLPQIHFVFTHFIGAVNRVWLRTLSYFPLPIELSKAECAKEKKGTLSRFNLKKKRILSESNWVNYCIKYLEQKAWKSFVYVYIMMENLN